jgi:sarcosine oxidase, subunit gamma
MLDLVQKRTGPAARSPVAAPVPATTALVAGWREGLAIVNLRGNAEDEAFRRAAASALGVELPIQPGSVSEGGAVRIVWAGPDDWFVIAPKGHAEALASKLREAMAGQHHAVTDVSSGYTVLHLSGTSVREVLAQGCPLDLHPRAFHCGSSAGSHFFKASVWLWQTEEAPAFELLVRRSFTGYVWLMLERCSVEHGFITRRFA